MSKYAKAIIAIVGAAVTAALGVFPPSSPAWTVAQIIAAVLTASGVYVVPNVKPAAK